MCHNYITARFGCQAIPEVPGIPDPYGNSRIGPSGRRIVRRGNVFVYCIS